MDLEGKRRRSKVLIYQKKKKEKKESGRKTRESANRQMERRKVSECHGLGQMGSRWE